MCTNFCIIPNTLPLTPENRRFVKRDVFKWSHGHTRERYAIPLLPKKDIPITPAPQYTNEHHCIFILRLFLRHMRLNQMRLFVRISALHYKGNKFTEWFWKIRSDMVKNLRTSLVILENATRGEHRKVSRS